jgi:hypothetical protein
MAAVFEVGLKHSSPRAIMDNMKPNPEVLIERVKSHLQKYRLYHQKSRDEFMTSYDKTLSEFKNISHDDNDDADDDVDRKFGCGEWAALLSHSVQEKQLLLRALKLQRMATKSRHCKILSRIRIKVGLQRMEYPFSIQKQLWRAGLGRQPPAPWSQSKHLPILKVGCHRKILVECCQHSICHYFW